MDNWINVNDKLPEEGKYLTIRRFDVNGISFSDPKVCELKFARYRTSGELSLDENGDKQPCWMKNGYAEQVDYWMPIPPNPINYWRPIEFTEKEEPTKIPVFAPDGAIDAEASMCEILSECLFDATVEKTYEKLLQATPEYIREESKELLKETAKKMVEMSDEKSQKFIDDQIVDHMKKNYE